MTKYIGLFLVIAFALVTCTPVQAQLAKPTNSTPRPTFNLRQQSQKPLIFKTPPPPPNIGAPSQRKAGGSRGCMNVNTQNTQSREKVLTALAPEYSTQLVLGLTTQIRPTFWFYVPYKSGSTYAKLVLEDENNQTIYKTPLTGTPGVVGVELPSTSEPLKIGKQYRWYFNIYCQQDNEFLTSVEGDVQLQPLNSIVQSELDKATPQQQVALYADNGVWYEALTTLAKERRIKPQDASLTSDWASLLGSVGLQNIAAEPIVDCCKLSQ
ncbi:hypothetical protein NIES4071_19710 [Calothrix sp. NIES-4071]|nr:hypothetical protein NIES4071_19710 [Calothrix sp. NIES-4071]BAZ56304.1 hypothetical protein NIES4105_19660 [Calothrix sp. NIES-4105]